MKVLESMQLIITKLNLKKVSLEFLLLNVNLLFNIKEQMLPNEYPMGFAYRGFIIFDKVIKDMKSNKIQNTPINK